MSNPTHITFNPPLKEKLFENEEKVTITGVYKYFDSYLVCHSSGYTDIKFIPEKVVGMIKEKIK